MPYYLFTLADDLPPIGACEELPNDEAASKVAAVVAAELARNRYGRDQLCVVVLDQRGRTVDRILAKDA